MRQEKFTSQIRCIMEDGENGEYNFKLVSGI